MATPAPAGSHQAEDISSTGGNNMETIPYDYSSRDRIIRGRMPTLEIINDRFVRMFRLTLSSALRKVVDVSVRSTELIKFGDFLRALPVPSSLNLFRMNPLRGNSIMVLDTRLVFDLIDQFFGGKGDRDINGEGRDFSAIEQRMVKRVVTSALEDFQFSWQPVLPLQITFTRSEVNPQFVAIVPHSEVVVLVTFAVEMGREPMRIQICIPYSLLEPIQSLLTAGYQSGRSQTDDVWRNRLATNIQGTTIQLAATIKGKSLSASKLVNLKKGDVLFAATNRGHSIALSVNGATKFEGVQAGGTHHRSIRIEAIIPAKTDEGLESIKAEARHLAENPNTENQRLKPDAQPAQQPPEGSAGVTTASGPRLDDLTPHSLANFINFEHPQTIALILANLWDTQRAGLAIEALAGPLQSDVIHRIATLREVQPGVLEEIHEVLESELRHYGDPDAPKAGGPEMVKEVLENMSEQSKNRVLLDIAKHYPDLADEIGMQNEPGALASTNKINSGGDNG